MMKKSLLLSVFVLLSILGFGQVNIGDILCVQGTDTVIVHPENYTGNALGVVFYVDETGQHGWALHPQVQVHQTYWSTMNELPWTMSRIVQH